MGFGREKGGEIKDCGFSPNLTKTGEGRDLLRNKNGPIKIRLFFFFFPFISHPFSVSLIP